MSIGILLQFIACTTFHLFEDEAVIMDTGDEILTPNPTVDLDWNLDALHITFANADNYEFRLGIAETSNECSIDMEYGCWVAEDCLHGYLSPQGNFPHPSYCHVLPGGESTLEYSNSLFGVMSGQNGEMVIPGSKTGFTAPTDEFSFEFQVTYFLQATQAGSNEVECWVWGNDPDYFRDQNCKVPLPISQTGLVLKDIGFPIERD